MTETKLGTVGFIGRFKPLHNGGAVLLECLCKNADRVIIGIGSCNKYDLRNPFTAEESWEMINSVLEPRFANYSIFTIPDFGHIPEYSDGQKWREHVKNAFGKLDHFVTGNEYAKELLKEDYHILPPGEMLPKEKQVRVKGSQVRLEMARGDAWKGLVPNQVAACLEKYNLIERFRKEFGLLTLASLTDENAFAENLDIEKKHVIGGGK